MNGTSWPWAVSRLCAAACLLASAGCGAEAAAGPKIEAEFPNLTVANEQLKLTLYLPAGGKSYYVGSRFDWSGVVARAEYAGHAFFGPWQPRDPKTHDHIMGTAEEFSMDDPPGFDEVEAGGVFFKIGVGGLEKIETVAKDKQTGKMEPEPYGFWRGHKIVKPGKWQISHGSDWVQFVQDFKGSRGWAWHYTKRLTLAKDAPAFTIWRVLKNTGSKTIDTTHYCHNFTLIDDEPIGTSYRIRLPFEARAKELKGRAAAVKGRRIVFLKDLAKGETVWMELAGLTGTAKDNHVVIENARTGAGVTITGDRPLVIFRFWSARLAACPEPFVAVKVAPGKSMTWKNTYTFHVRKAQK